MYDQYFVLISEEYFGVFSLNAQNYPQVLLDNINNGNVHIVSSSDLEYFLMEKLGRNILTVTNYCPYMQLGEVLSRSYR